ncbi:MAG: ferredoxin [Bacteroidetes bacterium]|nr:ferredoxin [Bacteroidota bacterium]
MIQISQQRAKCIGCNACVEAADYRWRVSKKDGKCTLVGGIEKRGFYTVVVHDHELDDNMIAAQNCPVKIITLLTLKSTAR